VILTESESKELLENVLKLSKADAAIATLSGDDVGNVRFALNTVTTSGFLDSLSVSIESHFGKRTGSVTTNEFDAASLETAVRKSEAIARLAPENAEYLLPLGPQEYLQGNGYYDETANATPDKLALLCESPLKEAIAKNVSSAGFVESGSNVSAMMTTKGLFAYYKSTVTTFQMSARTPDGTGSGWVGINVNDLKRLDTVTLGKTAVDKTVSSANPIDLDAGKYTVILEPSAVADLVGMLVFAMDARTADEGRSFFTKKGGGNKLGEKIFNDNVTIYSDPLDLAAPAGTYSNDGLPTSRINWVENGVLKFNVFTILGGEVGQVSGRHADERHHDGRHGHTRRLNQVRQTRHTCDAALVYSGSRPANVALDGTHAGWSVFN